MRSTEKAVQLQQDIALYEKKLQKILQIINLSEIECVCIVITGKRGISVAGDIIKWMPGYPPIDGRAPETIPVEFISFLQNYYSRLTNEKIILENQLTNINSE